MRRAQNRKPATYRCPLCGRMLPALSEHMLIVPEGDPAGRRHAHSACVLTAAQGRAAAHPRRVAAPPSPAAAPAPGPLARLRAALARPRRGAIGRVRAWRATCDSA